MVIYVHISKYNIYLYIRTCVYIYIERGIQCIFEKCIISAGTGVLPGEVHF